MNRHQRNEARQQIATACLAQMLSGLPEYAAGQTGYFAEIACDYADCLIAELERREEPAERAAT